MEVRWSVIKLLAKYLGNAVGAGVLGDVITDVLPDACKDAWAWWNKEKDEKAKRAELEGLMQVPLLEFREEVRQIVAAECAQKSPEQQQAIVGYLVQLPATIIRSQQRPADMKGKSLSPHQPLNQAKDLLALCPPGVSRFKPGYRPIPGLDLELVEPLGIGGFGEVWKARNPRMKNAPQVALKFCLAENARAALENETRVLDQIIRYGQHPGIVHLTNTYLDATPPFLAYELVEGGQLDGLIREWHSDGRRPDPSVVAERMLELVSIVGYMHRLSPPVVHRDLKPANVLLSSDGRGGFKFKIADFGIGGISSNKLLKKEGQNTGYYAASAMLPGSYTPHYASKQQMSGEAPDTRDDVYALGVIWYQMLIGDITVGRPGGSGWRKRLIERGVSVEMLELLDSCFEEEEEDRPQDAQILAERLRALVGAPIEKNPKVPQTFSPVGSFSPWVRVASLSDIGRHRAENEDAFLVDPRRSVLVVSDGMGGRAGGATAARIVVEILPKLFSASIAQHASPSDEEATRMLCKAFDALNQKVLDAAKEEPSLFGMGATVLFAYLRPTTVLLAHLGDSRAYLYREGRLRALTQDHSLAALLVNNGELTAEEAKNHPGRNVLSRYIGMEPFSYPEVQVFSPQASDWMLLVTDGVTSMLPDAQILQILEKSSSPEAACRSLIDESNKAGGKDNSTVVIVEWNKSYKVRAQKEI